MERLVLLGMNHQSAPIEVREQLAIGKQDIERILIHAHEHPQLEALAVLSTCNRVELYAVGLDKELGQQDITEIIANTRPEAGAVEKHHWYLKRNREVVRHLFRVSSGLDSMMVGEPQILGQVKDSYRLYCDHGDSHQLLHKMFHLGFRCGKRVRTETGLGEGNVSVASAAVDLATKIFGSLEDKRTLLIGAGETGELVAWHLKKKGIQRLFVSNRTLSRAECVAESLKGEVMPFQNWKNGILKADVIVFCTESPNYLLTSEELRALMEERRHRTLFLIDLGVPRNCDPACGEEELAFLYNLDDLQQMADTNLAGRKNDIPKAEAIVEETVEEYLHWYQTLGAEEVIRSLVSRLEEIRNLEVSKNRKHFEEKNWEHLELLTKGIIKRIFREPIARIKEYDGNMRHGLGRIETIQELFGLRDDTKEEEDRPGNSR